MPTLNSDHNLYPAARHRPNSPSAGYDPFLHTTIDHLNSPPTLNVKQPVYSFNHTLGQAPQLAAPFDDRTLGASINHYSPEPFPEDDPLDPHDFYRRYQNTDGRGQMEGLGQSDLVVVTPGDNMITSHQYARSNPGSVRTNGVKLGLLSSRVHSAYGSRNQSSSTEHSPITTAKPSLMSPGASRNRQTSLKDLVDRFNQTPDEVPPLPRKSASRSASTNSNNPSNPPYNLAGALSQSKSGGALKAGRVDDVDQPYPGKVTRLHHRRGRRSEDKEIPPRSARSPVSPWTIRPDLNTFASQSMTDLNPSGPPFHRKPLFGEVLPISFNPGDVGYGIPGPRRRRGSEGSMHSPNPMFPDEIQPRRVSPSSPSAWYLGLTPTLEEIKMEKMIPNLPPKMHRRTRSDFAGLLPRPPVSSTPMPIPDPSSYEAPSSPLQSSKPILPTTPVNNLPHRRDSQSRIPISSRRLSTTSDSGNSNPSTRTNSALERHSTQFATVKSGSAIPKSAVKPRSPIRTTRPATSRNSPRRGDYSPRQQPATSPRLTAYITAPLPKKSPPLRSSRPRLPVSSASTSASRARAVERLADRESGDSRNVREIRSRRPPELGAVDFAARRQKIQQAFTRTVQENERQAIEAQRRRMLMAQERQIAPHEAAEGFVPEPLNIPPSDKQPNGHVLRSEIQRDTEEKLFLAPSEDVTGAERELMVDTGPITTRPTLDLDQEDSPTLGGFHRYTDSKEVDREPSSALTESTSNSVDTYFDQEPQEDSPGSHHEHQTLLSHVMSIRDDSPTSPDCLESAPTTGESSSEKDDQESIHIMLGETPVLEKALYKGPLQEQGTDGDFEAAPDNRWSVSSWASSTRSDDPKSSDQERLAPMERIDEHSPMKPNDSSHLSVSTGSSCQTPQPWSPATFASPLTNRTTMESDTYSTINRVLDHYHDQNLLSPDLNNVQQHLITQSPDLARQGGWDPKKVTQLYLQELARARNQQAAGTLNAPNNPLKPLLSSGVIHEEPTGLDEKQVVEPPVEKEAVPPRASLDVVQNDSNPHRASLNAPADWDMSPSITDWIHLQAESPSDEKPANPPKDWRNVDEQGSEQCEMNNQTLTLAHDYPPELPEIQGAGEGLGIGGLAISVTEPQDDDSPTIPPPPLPDHLPPPPPIESLPEEDTSFSVNVTSPPSPSVYSSHFSSIYPSGLSSDPTITADSEETFRVIGTTTSALPSVRSSMSRDAPSTIASSETAGKLPSTSPDQKRLIRRRHIIKELVDTEHSFGQDMKVVDDIYKGTSNVIIISAEDVKTLFSNSDQIVNFSTNFLDALKQAARGVYVLPKSKRWRSNRTSDTTSYSCNTDDQSSISGGELTDEERDRKTFIGEAFEHHMATMEKVYGDYLKNHDVANQKLQQLQKNPKVQIWLKECRAYAHDLTSAWDLDSLLVKPVQRILKYPLLLDQLLEVTPENHPDFVKLDVAAREMKGISMRINEMKKQADLMKQVANNANGRNRKDSDVRNGLSKAFGRRAEKLRQQVGLSDLVEDKGYAAVSERFGSHFFQLQVVMRDVEMYTNDVQHFMNRFADFILAIEAYIDVAQSTYPEVESKWRKFRMSTREISMTALTDHIAAVRKNVIEPMTTLLKLHDGPQKFMQKRSKRLLDYARFKAIKDRGEKPDKKLAEQGEQFIAINETLKEELPKLFALTGKLVEACLNNFVQLQLQWNVIWRRKLSQAIDDCKVPGQISDIVDSFAGDFAFFEAQVLSLGICNGSMLAEAVNQVSMLSPSTNGGVDGTASPGGVSSSLDVTKRRTLSFSSDRSPMLPQPDFGTRNFSVENGLQLATGGLVALNQDMSNRRVRASSTVSSLGPRTPEAPNAYRSYFNGSSSVANHVRPVTSISRTTTEPSPSLPRSSLDVPNGNRLSGEGPLVNRPRSGSTYPPPLTASTGANGRSAESMSSQISQDIHQRSSSPSSRFSGLFSSAMPMSDSPPEQLPTTAPLGNSEYKVLFLAASVYEFNIDRARKEAGYPYLTYVAGEIFDVIGEKGELWLSKNQDDSTNQVGWIWNKHFVKLAS